jgi:hypothetical protein
LGFGWSDGASGSLHREDGSVSSIRPMAGHRQQRGESTSRLHALVGQDGTGRRRWASKAFQVRRSKRVRALAAHVTETAEDRNAAATVTRKADCLFDAR